MLLLKPAPSELIYIRCPAPEFSPIFGSLRNEIYFLKIRCKLRRRAPDIYQLRRSWLQKQYGINSVAGNLCSSFWSQESPCILFLYLVRLKWKSTQSLARGSVGQFLCSKPTFSGVLMENLNRLRYALWVKMKKFCFDVKLWNCEIKIWKLKKTYFFAPQDVFCGLLEPFLVASAALIF